MDGLYVGRWMGGGWMDYVGRWMGGGWMDYMWVDGWVVVAWIICG